MFKRIPFKVNRVVLTLVYAYFLFFTATGFLTPVIAVYFTDGITGGSLAAAGFATTIFWIVKSAVQVPVSVYADRHRGEGDDFGIMMIGLLIASATYLLYFFFATNIYHVYLFEAIKGVGHGMLTPTFLAIFTRHIDKDKENIEWTLHSNSVGVGLALSGAAGGLMADVFGFHAIFLLSAAFSFLAPLTMMLVKDELMCGPDGCRAPAKAHFENITHHQH